MHGFILFLQWVTKFSIYPIVFWNKMSSDYSLDSILWALVFILFLLLLVWVFRILGRLLYDNWFDISWLSIVNPTRPECLLEHLGFETLHDYWECHIVKSSIFSIDHLQYIQGSLWYIKNNVLRNFFTNPDHSFRTKVQECYTSRMQRFLVKSNYLFIPELLASNLDAILIFLIILINLKVCFLLIHAKYI